MPFNQVQCDRLDVWDRDSPGWRKLERSVGELIGGQAPRRLGQTTRGAPSVAGVSVCVLPFSNMSGDAEQEYFADGISEDIITDLSKVSALSVVARNTAFTFKSKAIDVPTVARQLGVSHVLEGSVRKSGSRVRITAQLIDGAAGDHLWAERWDRELDDIFALQDEISEAIVAALRVKLLPRERKAIERRDTSVPEAYDLYLLARQFWVSGNEGDRRRDEAILRLCRQATALDPDYARAWALMALVQTELRFRHGQEEDDGVAAAEQALRIDGSLAEAHAVRARYLAEQGRLEESRAAINTALQLDPESWEVSREAGTLAFREGRVAEAVPYFERATALMENDYFDPGFLAVCYTALNQPGQAARAAQITVQRAERAVASDGGNGAALAHGAYSLACLGEVGRAREWASRALLIDPDNLITRYRLACLFANQLSDPGSALAMLELYFRGCSMRRLRYAETDPDLDPLRDDPRYRAMVAAAAARLAESGVQ